MSTDNGEPATDGRKKRWLSQRAEKLRIPTYDSTMESDVEQSRLRLSRMLTGGNAGGIVATLSLIGTMLARGGTAAPTIPWPLFVALLTFVLGLLAAYAGSVIDHRIADLRRRAAAIRVEKFNVTAAPLGAAAARRELVLVVIMARLAYSMASIAMVVGTAIGIYVLSTLVVW